jgi:predicted ArsR family transcriptional regulator
VPVETSRHQADVEAQVRSIASLGEPVRRALYRFVAAQRQPVSREQAAAGVHVAHHVAKFHLDKLEQDGLLEVEFRRPSGRTGPGAGRPAKFYRRAAREIAVSLPERRYDVAGELMAEAITASTRTGQPVSEALRTAARAAGRQIGGDVVAASGRRSTPAVLVDAVCDVLTDIGYEPRPSESSITLDNCPFHRLAKEHTELVCGMNLELLGGLVDSVGERLSAVLDPAEDRCCVRIDRRATSNG